MTERVFRGERDQDGCGRVHLDGELLAPESPLWETSLCLRNHSPSGPEWGYHGSGPAQLAITMLMAVTDTDEAERYYPLFRSGVLALIRGDRWTLPVHQVETWLAGVRNHDHQVFSVSAEADRDGALLVHITPPSSGRKAAPIQEGSIR